MKRSNHSIHVCDQCDHDHSLLCLSGFPSLMFLTSLKLLQTLPQGSRHCQFLPLLSLRRIQPLRSQKVLLLKCVWMIRFLICPLGRLFLLGQLQLRNFTFSPGQYSPFSGPPPFLLLLLLRSLSLSCNPYRGSLLFLSALHVTQCFLVNRLSPCVSLSRIDSHLLFAGHATEVNTALNATWPRCLGGALYCRQFFDIAKTACHRPDSWLVVAVKEALEQEHVAGIPRTAIWISDCAVKTTPGRSCAASVKPRPQRVVFQYLPPSSRLLCLNF